MTFGKFIFGLIITAIGFLIVWKSDWLMNNFGRIGFAEKHLGTEGGSRLLYKIIGLVIIFIGFMYATDLTDSLLNWIANTVFKAQLPS
ncbi:MAG: hypothetical protein PHO91_03950 [Patescibacteria group bacterium]|nr:hypothetical protein [Patescibacteria group bacterium]